MKPIHNAPPLLPRITGKPQLIDTHCHLDMEAYHADLDEILLAAAHHGVGKIITIGIDNHSSKNAVMLAHRYRNVFATVGFHPHDAERATPDTLQQLAELAVDRKVVGFGEIGLDYVKNYAPQDVQRKVFTEQLHLAKDLDLPIVIHDREAHGDVCRLIEAAGTFPRGGVMHCFSGDRYLAEQMIGMGFAISIPGVVTFANAHVLHEVVRCIDLQHLLLETDGPYLAPVPFRGKRNEPMLLVLTAQKVANIKGVALEEVAEVTTANATRLFRLPGTDYDS
jgi:TatD DNase family protein